MDLQSAVAGRGMDAVPRLEAADDHLGRQRGRRVRGGFGRLLGGDLGLGHGFVLRSAAGGRQGQEGSQEEEEEQRSKGGEGEGDDEEEKD